MKKSIEYSERISEILGNQKTTTTNYRSWKSGKTWLFAAAVLAFVGGAAAAPVVSAHADTTPVPASATPTAVTNVKVPAADVYTGASTGTATAATSGGTNFGGEAHATTSLGSQVGMTNQVSATSGMPAVASSAPIAGGSTVAGDAVTNPVEYFLYNHTAQAVSAAASAGVIASAAAAYASAYPTSSNVSLAAVAASAASEANSLDAVLQASLGSLEGEAGIQYSAYQAALTEFAAKGSTAAYASLMALGNSAYAQVDVWGGHSMTATGTTVNVSAAGSSQAFSVTIPSTGVFSSAGNVYGLEGVQAVIASLYSVASAAFYGVAAQSATSSASAIAQVQGMVATPGATGAGSTAKYGKYGAVVTMDSVVDVMTGATAAGKQGELGVFAENANVVNNMTTPTVTLSSGASLDFTIASGSALASGASSAAVAMIAGNGYSYLSAFYTDYYDTTGSAGKFENLLTAPKSGTSYTVAGSAVTPEFILNKSAQISVSGASALEAAMASHTAGTYAVTYTLSIPADPSLPAAHITIDFIIPGATTPTPTPETPTATTPAAPAVKPVAAAATKAVATALPATGDSDTNAAIFAGAAAVVGGMTLAGLQMKKRKD